MGMAWETKYALFSLEYGQNVPAELLNLISLE
jgi:hypothetical protein